jgi:hemerythrin-like domain-containing protein
MMPIGPLMKEHRVIEKMIAMLDARAAAWRAGAEVDERFLDAAVDFIRTYADRTHHGKEEDILFAALAKRPLSEDDSRVMGELITDHQVARSAVRDILAAEGAYFAGDRTARSMLLEKCAVLTTLYPPHICKEDKVFFRASMHYFDEDERAAMLADMDRFDAGMIHEKYRKVVDEWMESEGR